MREMREILFRGKRVDTREWIIGFYCPKSFSHFPCSLAIFPAKTINISWSGFEVDPETVGQYTGLTDENDVKIFEGDIVKACYPNKYEFVKDEFTEKITFRNGCFWFGNWNFIEFLDRFRNYKVIGNIHDNPELLIKT